MTKIETFQLEDVELLRLKLAHEAIARREAELQTARMTLSLLNTQIATKYSAEGRYTLVGDIGADGRGRRTLRVQPAPEVEAVPVPVSD